MNKKQIKNLVKKQLLESISLADEVVGKLNKKSLGFRGYINEEILEGTISDVNNYAKENNLTFTSCSDSKFGGHYTGEIEVYEFSPNPDFYGKIMEHTMSALSSLERITGNNSVVLSKTNDSVINEGVTRMIENADLMEFTIQPILNNISCKRANEMFDPTTLKKYANIIIKDAESHDDTLNEFKEEDLDKLNSIVVKYINENTTNHIKKFEYDDESILKNYNKLFVSKNF